MPGISLVIITHNEERNIERCINSATAIADQVIVVDSGSTDRTEEICKNLGAEFHFRKWDGYSGQKNFANSLARESYILSLDADECLSDELRSSVLELKQELDGVYGFNRLTNYCGSWIRHSGWYPDTKYRLFPRSIAEWKGDFVHEELHFHGNPGKTILEGDLLHYSYTNREEHRKRADKYSSLTAKKLFNNGKNAGPLKPYLSAVGRWLKMYVFQGGFKDGKAGKTIASISARSNIFKYKELRRLHKSRALSRKVKTIALSRTDSIGDVMLTLPMAGVIKSEWPDCRIIFLGRSYTEQVIRCSEHVDAFLNMDELVGRSEDETIKAIQHEKIDAFVHVFPQKAIAKWVKSSGISIRIGTGRRLFNLFTCNYKTWYSRKNSELHESELNIKMLQQLSLPWNLDKSDLPRYYGFNSKAPLPEEVSPLLRFSGKKVILHPKSKGSAVEWSINDYAILAKQLTDEGCRVFVTGTETERGLIGDDFPWDNPEIHDITGKLSLSELISFIDHCDYLVAASTGPLHIAAALGIHAIGLYTPQRPMHPGRWAPIGVKAQVISASHHPQKNESLAISADVVSGLILR